MAWISQRRGRLLSLGVLLGCRVMNIDWANLSELQERYEKLRGFL
ncbi:hypothetical protein [Candidatus Methylacidithermus pantelleriae]|nr:hypothetical protein [Candidatus Methylacidithermus pantelleriae]